MSPEAAREGIRKAIAVYRSGHVPAVIHPYRYWGRIERVVDADTVDVQLDLGFEISLNVRFRLIGVDAPETYGVRHDSEEYARGLEAVEFVRSLIKRDDWVEIESYSGPREKYGRWLCQLFVDGQSLNERLLVEGHGTLYPGSP